jgi:hypothetical protein
MKLLLPQNRSFLPSALLLVIHLIAAKEHLEDARNKNCYGMSRYDRSFVYKKQNTREAYFPVVKVAQAILRTIESHLCFIGIRHGKLTHQSLLVIRGGKS